MPHSFGPAIYLQGLQEASSIQRVIGLLSSRNTRNKGSWYILAISLDILISMMAFHITRRAQNICKTSWNCTVVFPRVLMMDSTKLYRTYSKTTPRVSAFNFGRKTKIVQLISVGRVLCFQMRCTIITIFSQRAG